MVSGSQFDVSIGEQDPRNRHKPNGTPNKTRSRRNSFGINKNKSVRANAVENDSQTKNLKNPKEISSIT
jgi:hypothetical protein